MYKKILLLFLSIIFVLGCREENIEPELYGNIKGSILDSETNKPIDNVSITTSPSTSAVQSQNDGSFTISHIPVDSYTITAKKNGYDKETVGVSLNDESTVSAVIYLEKSTDDYELPTSPTNPYPENEADEQSISFDFSWTASECDDGDTLTYDVFMYQSNSMLRIQIASSISDTTITINNLDYGATYFWYVVAKGEYSGETKSELWSFTTKAKPLNPIIVSYESTENNGYDIYSISQIGEDLLKIISVNGDALWPRYSPNKRFIAYSSSNGLETNIYIVKSDGSENYKLSDISVAGYHNSGYGFSWTNDGGEIVFAHYEKLYKVRSDGSGLTVVATAPEGRQFRECDCSPLNNDIVALTIGSNINDSEIYLIHENTDSLELVIDNLPGIVERPSFSIDGNNILFSHDASGNETITGRQLDSRIYSYNLATKQSDNISANKAAGTNDFNPRYSANGAKIIFNNSSNVQESVAALMIMDTDGRNRTKLIDYAIMPDWK